MELIEVKEPHVTFNEHGKNRRCDFCKAEEDKIRLVGRFIVKLKSVDVFGVKKLACQTCFRKNVEIQKSRRFSGEKSISINFKQNHNISLLFKQMVSRILHVVAFTLLLSTTAFAQPILPSQPEQTPIDGGLGILAAAGGAYALKKLKDRKNSETD